MNEKNELMESQSKEVNDFLEQVGITEISFNTLTGEELESIGYSKVKRGMFGLESLFRELSKEISVEAVKKEAKQAFNNAIADSYKCILDPGKHLANIKGSPDLFIGAALDNDTNILAGQARFKVNDGVLAFSSQIVPKAFDGLAIVTSQYFMKQINDELSVIEADISGIKRYLENKQQGELESAFKSIRSIIRHMEFTRISEKRISDAMISLNGIEKVACDSIGLYRREIKDIMKTCRERDSANEVKNAMEKLHQNLLLYYYAICIVGAVKLTAIVLRNINNPDELEVFEDEIKEINMAYKEIYHEAMVWSSKYLDTVISLNETNAGEKAIAAGMEAIFDFIQVKAKSRVYTGGVYNKVNDLLLDRHERMKQPIITEHQLFEKQLEEKIMLDKYMDSINRYIDNISQKVEVVSIGEDYYIKYLE